MNPISNQQALAAFVNAFIDAVIGMDIGVERKDFQIVSTVGDMDCKLVLERTIGTFEVFVGEGYDGVPEYFVNANRGAGEHRNFICHSGTASLHRAIFNLGAAFHQMGEGYADEEESLSRLAAA